MIGADGGPVPGFRIGGGDKFRFGKNQGARRGLDFIPFRNRAEEKAFVFPSLSRILRDSSLEEVTQ